MTIATQNQSLFLGKLLSQVCIMGLGVVVILHRLGNESLAQAIITAVLLVAVFGAARILFWRRDVQWVVHPFTSLGSLAHPLMTVLPALVLVALIAPSSSLRDPMVFAAVMGWTVVGVASAHIGLALRLKHSTKHGRGHPSSVLIAGNNSQSGKTVESWLSDSPFPVKVLGFVDVVDQSDPWNRNVDQDHMPFLGDVSKLLPLLSNRVVDEVWITLPLKSRFAEIETIVQTCETVGVPVRMTPNPFQSTTGTVLQRSGSSAAEMFYVACPGKPLPLLVKRIIDIGASALGLLVLSPLFIVIAALIKITSRGPVFFCQERCGLHGRSFTLFKFRSMVVDAEDLKKDLVAKNEGSGPTFKMLHDPRVTSIGNLLRKASLDELPQLWNTFRGDMSLVGPRPPVASEVAQYEPWQRRRLSVRPGITCIWQASGRSNIGFEQWMLMDLDYVHSWSLGLDFRLLLKTIPAVILMRGAQ
ncbi:MAG: sugar transferase [Planctomycetota bacterium]